MTIFDVDIDALAGGSVKMDRYRGHVVLVVNVASRCGLTPQYAGLETLHEKYADRGFTVLGVPCNQFGGQEPGSPEEIATFCSATYGVSFPMTEKVDVNGANRHRLYEQLASEPDASGEAGDVQWNFEKFLVAPNGDVVARFRPTVTPEDPALVSAVEALLPG